MSYTATTAALSRLSGTPGWHARLRLAVKSAQTPRIVAALLALAVAINVAHEVATLMQLHRGPAEAVPTWHESSAPPRGASTAVIVGAHLFGVAPRPAAADRGPPAEEKSLVLTGTVAGEDPATGYAFIGTTREQTHFYTAGARTPEGALLLKVYRDHVLIERGGRRLTLSLPRRLDLHSLATPDTAAVADATERPHEPTPDEMTAALQGESSRMGELLTEKPLFVNDKLFGVQIEAGSSTELLMQLGLHPGDILKTVDGTVITPQRLDFLRTRLASGDPVKLAGMRPGQGQFNITIDGSAVAGMIAP